MGKLDGKVAVITGGISGIGAATAKVFAQEGAKLVLVDLDVTAGENFVEEMKAYTEDAIFVTADVANESDVNRVIQTAVDTFGTIDIYFNNAGIGWVQPTEDLAFEDYRKVVSVDLDAVFLNAQQAIKLFLGQGKEGVVVNTASMYGWVGSPGSAPYNAAKGGVINLTRSLGVEFADRNIRINALCPGYIDTPIIPEDQKEQLRSVTPMRRLGTSDEMAKAALFLASDDSSFMTGNTLTIDGGFTAQ